VVCLVTTLWQIFHRMRQWKNFDNWLIFDKDMDKNLWLTFLGHPVERSLGVKCDNEHRLMKTFYESLPYDSPSRAVVCQSLWPSICPIRGSHYGKSSKSKREEHCIIVVPRRSKPHQSTSAELSHEMHHNSGREASRLSYYSTDYSDASLLRAL